MEEAGMTSADIKRFYDQHVKPLSAVDRRQLLELLQRELEIETDNHQYSILELEGLGAEIWYGIDAQMYVDHLRSEWDHRP